MAQMMKRIRIGDFFKLTVFASRQSDSKAAICFRLLFWCLGPVRLPPSVFIFFKFGAIATNIFLNFSVVSEENLLRGCGV